MTDTDLKTHLLALAKDVLNQSQITNNGLSPEREKTGFSDQLVPGTGGTAFYNPMRDARIIRLPAFPLAVNALQALQQFLTAPDPSEAKRVVLQFTYDFLERQSGSEFDDSVFAATWSSFQEELARPEWTYLGICYLENLDSDADSVELGDGVTIYNRSSYRFRESGWSDFQIEKLYENWKGRGQYVLVTEVKAPKTPDNLILGNTGVEVSKALRMLRALRLAKEGDVHIGGGTQILGRVLTTRPAGSGFSPDPGAAMHGSITRWPGTTYSLSTSDASHVQDLYGQLKLVEDMGDSAPYNLNLALRSFASSYDRLPALNDTKLVDLITATESLVGTGAEISFRLSFYIAGILGGTDSERVTIFSEMRDFYDTRNKVVHGGTLETKHRAHLENYPALRDYVRRLLAAYMRLATTSGHGYDPKPLRRRLDSILQDTQQRAALRVAMGLEQGAVANGIAAARSEAMPAPRWWQRRRARPGTGWRRWIPH
jgi:hypothetical protein